MKVIWKDKEYIVAACENASSVSEILKELGIATNGGGFRTLKKYAEIYGIELPNGNSQVRDKSYRPIEEILVANSTYAQGHIARRIKKSQLLDYACANCKNDGTWQNEQLVLQLDHINGVGNDNRIENLRWLCPNCHSQTATWGRKNRLR